MESDQMPRQTIEPIACTMQVAQQISGYSRTRLYQAIARKELKSWMVGRRRMTSPAYLREMIQADQLKCGVDVAA